MRIDIITIFPHIFDSYFNESIISRARKKGMISIAVHDLRDFTSDKHRKVDDTPYGGGAGMVLKVEPISKAVGSLKHESPDGKLKTRTILFSAKGKRYTQAVARRLSKYDRLIMICGRYEGVDERVAEHVADEEISIGDFVLTGGELSAMVVADSVSRLVPGVLGNEDSLKFESHSTRGYLEYPQYTKPEVFDGLKVPGVLLGGHHGEIEKWREEKSKNKKR